MKATQTFFSMLLLPLLLCCGNENPSTPADGNGDSFETQHFSFALYDGLPVSMVAGIPEMLERNYQRIMDDLQVPTLPRITAKIWLERESFMAAMERDLGIRYVGAAGYVMGLDEFRMLFLSNSNTTPVHEFVHVVSLHVNSRIANNPRWLWEAVAVYEAGEFVDPKNLPFMVSGDYPTLAELSSDYNSSNGDIYRVGYVLLEYIVQAWGPDAVRQLIETNGNLQSVLGITTQEFETGWHRFIEEKYLN